MRVPLVFLLLSCSLSLSWGGVVLENGFPILWNQAATQHAELPKTDGELTPNPWDYLQRMSLIRFLIKDTDPHMKSMGPGENENPLWGPALRMAWMFTSGRLADPMGATTCGAQTGDTRDTCISPNSWFGCMHYYSSVMPFLAAAHNGYLGEGVSVQMQNPAGAEAYCNTYDACKTAYPDLMAKWDAFFTGLKEKAASTLPDNEKKDAILGLYWEAQLASWHHSSSFCHDKLNSYSPEEKEFAEDWLYMVEYSAVVHFQSSLEQAPKFLIPMPRRLMKAGDVAPNISDMTPEENLMLWAFAWTKMSDSFFGGNMKKMWRKVMCSPTA